MFYDKVLAPLGCVRLWTYADGAGYGPPGKDDVFAIKRDTLDMIANAKRSHVAFAAQDCVAVQRFYAAAMSLGAIDEGPPALCPEYGPNYFAAFVRDLDGYRLEAVHHGSTLLH